MLSRTVLFLVSFICVTARRDSCKILLQFPDIETPLFPSKLGQKRFTPPLIETELEPFFHYPEIIDETRQFIGTPPRRSIVVACPGKWNRILNKENIIGRVSCSRRGTSILLNHQRVPASQVACHRRPRGCLLHTQMACHGDREGVVHVIGWRMEEGWFIPQITVCWDKARETTIYTRHVIYGRYLEQRVASPGRPSFKPGKLFSHTIKDLYKRKFQLELFGSQLGEVPRVPGLTRYYFARGHLAPDADFVLPAEQDATYFYSNVVPQFQRFNNGNWKAMESSVRELANQRNRSFIVFTGTMETPLTLRDINANEVPIYLDPEGKKYPAPLIMWKVVYDPFVKEVVAILGLNILDEDEALLSYFFSLCNDICDHLLWSTWKPKDWKKGAMLCCRWEEFRTYVPRMADFGKVNILKD